MTVNFKEGQTQVGTPTMVLMPSRNYAFKISDELYVIKIPRKGSYHEIDPEFFSKEDGEFNLYDGKTKVMYLPAITKVLYATKKYPDLGDHQLFAPMSLKFKRNEVEISGYVVDMLLASETEEV